MRITLKRLIKPAIIFTAGFLSGVFICYFLIFAIKNTDDVILQDAKSSPTNYLPGQYTAVSYINMGGGAAGYCDVYVAVVPAYNFDEFQYSTYNVASTTECGADITLTWIGEQTLEISGLDDIEYQLKSNSDGKIKIIYRENTY